MTCQKIKQVMKSIKLFVDSAEKLEFCSMSICNLKLSSVIEQDNDKKCLRTSPHPLVPKQTNKKSESI